MKHFKNLELTAGAILASLAGSSLASANHSATAHASTTVVSKDNTNAEDKSQATKKDESKTLSFSTASAEANAKNVNRGDTGTSPLKATADSDVPLSPSDAKAQINNVNKSDEKKNFDQAVDEAKKTDGIQVIQDANVKHQASKTSEIDVKKDYQDQADTIKKQVEVQKQKLADYNTKKQAYDKNRQDFINELKQEGLWQEGTTDLSKLGQKLSIQSETQAKVSAQLLQNVGTINGNALTFTDTNAIKGDFLHLSYSNLKNSSYNGKAINEITIDFSDKKTSGAINSSLTWGNDPTDGWWYNGCSGVTATIKLFDVNGKQISITNDAPAYISPGSLNHDLGGKVETVQLYSNGKGIKIPESSVNVHDGNILYSDKANWIGDSGKEWGERYAQISPDSMSMAKNIWGNEIATKYQHWDGSSSDTPERIFGCGLYQVEGNEIKLRSYIDNDADGLAPSVWFTWSTTVPQTSFDAEGPQKPTTTVHYHDNEIQVPASITVKYVDQDTSKEIPDTQFEQKGNEGDNITYTTADTISKLQLQGYTLVSDDFTGKAGNKLSEDNNGKTYVVTLKKQSQDKPSTPETKDGTQTYHFVDKNTGKVLTTDKVGGKVGEDVSVSLKVPDGYHLVEGQTVPTSANIKDKDNPINILVEKDPTPAKPSTPETKDGTQTYHFVDKNTGKVLTTDKVGGKVGEDVSVSLKVPDGYHLVEGQTVPTSANIKDKDNPINILVEKDPTPAKPSTPETKDGTQTIHIIDKKTGNVLTTVVKGGKIGENIPVSLKVPKGYHLVQGQKLPTSVNIKDKDNAINVYVEKDEAKPTVTTPSNNNNSKATPAPVENTKAPATIANASVKAPSASVANNTSAPAQQATLPQTGNSSSTAGIVAGSTLLATMATLGIAYRKRKN